MSLFGVGGPVGVGPINAFDVMVMQSNKDLYDLKEECEAAIAAGITSEAVILEIKERNTFKDMLYNDQVELIKEIEKMDKMRKYK